MTGKIVNLRAWRKAKARDDKRVQGDGNAARHGRTRAERAAEDAARAKADRHLDDHKRDE